MRCINAITLNFPLILFIRCIAYHFIGLNLLILTKSHAPFIASFPLSFHKGKPFLKKECFTPKI